MNITVKVLPKPVLHPWTDGVNFITPKPDFEADAQAMLKQLEADNRNDTAEQDKEEKSKSEVDEESGITEGG